MTDEATREPTPKPKRSNARFYRVVWRWHFYAGLIVLPILVTAAITGGLYVFRDELEPLIYSELQVTPGPTTVPYATQLELARAAANPGSTATGFFIREDPTRAVEVSFSQEDSDAFTYVYVDPYAGAVTGQIAYGSSIFDIDLEIHRNLFTGTIGRYVVELATSWGVILLVTGVYLWWPRGKKKVAGVAYPRVKGKRYVLWRDWHAVPGAYFAIFAFLVMGTGLFFTQLFAEGYDAVAKATDSYPASFATPPVSTVPENGTPLTIDDVLAIAWREQPEREVYVGLPAGPEEAFSIYAGKNDSPTRVSQYYVDQYSGDILDTIRWQHLSAMMKVSISAYPIHVGSIYGLTTKVLACLTCVVIMASGITGAVMWWMRRPNGRTGFPKKPSDHTPALWLVLLICFLGVLMPAAGASMLLILVGDWGWSKWQKGSEPPTTLDI
ncbi:MAG: PepSY domain-containing protein [Acidobacteria bacterium]|nr:PepSY domain-containing protein [Acidobacteriota bacterium]